MILEHFKKGRAHCPGNLLSTGPGMPTIGLAAIRKSKANIAGKFPGKLVVSRFSTRCCNWDLCSKLAGTYASADTFARQLHSGDCGLSFGAAPLCNHVRGI